MLILLKTVFSYWREIAVAIIVATGVFILMSWWEGSAEISRLKTQLNFAAEQNENLVEKIAIYDKAEAVARERIERTTKERAEIVQILTKEINKIRNQPIPKDCQGAVDYGVKFKDDLQWPSTDK